MVKYKNNPDTIGSLSFPWQGRIMCDQKRNKHYGK